MLEPDSLNLRLVSRRANTSRALAFGLGAGLYFEYWQRPQESPSRFFTGHNRQLERELEARLELWHNGDRRGVIIDALRANALAMNLDRAPTVGIMGIEMLAEDFENWASATDWKECARAAGQTIARTGALHRRRYVEFLREAAQWFDPADSVVRIIDEIADEWHAFGAGLFLLTNGDFSDASRAIRRLAMREEYFWGRVLGIISDSRF